MKKFLLYIITTAALVFSGNSLPLYGKVKSFSALAFKGTVYVSKAEIIRKAGIRSKGKAILVDMDMLDKSIKSFSIIREHTLTEEGEKLVITVVERNPVIIVAMEWPSETIVFELDEEQSIITLNRVHDSGLPIVHVDGGKRTAVRVAGKLKAFCRVLLGVKLKQRRLFNEITDIYYSPVMSMIVLRKRRTRFFLGNELEDFSRLQYIAGYLDSKGRYPKTVTINNDKVLIKEGA